MKRNIFVKFVIISLIAVFVVLTAFFSGYWYLYRESVVFSKLDSTGRFKLTARCGLNNTESSYVTYLTVETAKDGLLLVRTYIDSNDLFLDCSEGRGKITDLELADDRSSVLVKFESKVSITCPIFVEFEPVLSE